MASEAEASCESDPNFAIICAFMDKFGESCGIPCIDFIELQQMLENNQEVSPELMNLHIKLLRKTKKNVTVERWERALINMCHSFSSKHAWEIERFGYKKTRLPIKLRALKELLEMQFDYNTKFKNEVNRMTAEELRSQPLGRDKLGRAYWFQTDNNYQIRIYKEDPDEETWNLIAKDRDGLLSLITELSDGDSKLSSDSACNEDSNSLLEKPFVDTGQNENSEIKVTEDEAAQNEDEVSISSTNSNFDLPSEKRKSVFEDSSISVKKIYDSQKQSVISEQKPAETSVEKLKEEEVKPKKEELTEIRRPMLRIKSLSELMEKPKEPPRSTFLPDLPELTITKKPKLDLPEITIVKRPRMQQPSRMRDPQVSPAIESPLMIIRGNGSGNENKGGNSIVEKEIVEPALFFSGRGSGRDCETGNRESSKSAEKIVELLDNRCDELFIGDEIEEPIMYFFGRGTGKDCKTGNQKDSSKVHTDDEQSKSSSACAITPSQVDSGETAKQIPTSQLINIKLGTVIDSKTDSRTFLPRSPNKKSRWDQKEMQGSEADEKCENNLSPKKMTFFFGPGSLNVKPNPSLNTSFGELENEHSEKKDVVPDNNVTLAQDAKSDVVPEVNEDNGAQEQNEVPPLRESSEENGPKYLEDENRANDQNPDHGDLENTPNVSSIEEEEKCKSSDIHVEEQKESPSLLKTDQQPENVSVHLVTKVDTEKEKLLVDDARSESLQNECIQGANKEKLNECPENKEEEKLQNDFHEHKVGEEVQNETKENEESQNETKKEDIQKEKENLVHHRDDLDSFTEVLSDKDTELKHKDIQSIVMDNQLDNIKETEENYPESVDQSENVHNETNDEEISDINEKPDFVPEVGNTFQEEITPDLNEEIGEASIPSVLENIKISEVKETEIVSKLDECLTSNRSDDKIVETVEIIHQNTPHRTSDNLSCNELTHEIETAKRNNESEELKPSEQKESADPILDESHLDEGKLSGNQNELLMDETKTDKSEEANPLERIVSADNNLDKSLSDNEKLSENQNEERTDGNKADDNDELCTVGQSANANKIIDDNMEVQIDQEVLINDKESENLGSATEKEIVKKNDKQDEITKSEIAIDNNVTHETADKSLKRGRTVDTGSPEDHFSEEIQTIVEPLEDTHKNEQEKLSKSAPEDVPPGKKRRGRKVISDSKKTLTKSQPIELTTIRPIRQTRQTKAIIIETPPLIKPAKGRSRRKASIQVTKSDETGSTDSPIPLESVTVNDVDSNSAAADNTETDPLAVSEDELENGGQAITSITSFSFDYDPSSPAAKKNRRKRGRETFENKPEAGETIGKKPKIKGKRTVDLTLRKSVEEKRQKEVGDVSSDDNESVKPTTKKEAKAKKRVSLKKKAVSPPVSDSDNAVQNLNIKKNISKKRNARLLKNLGVKEEDISALADSPVPVRQSRRLAQIKIKEDAAIRRKIEEDDVTITRKKKKKEEDKDFKGGKRKRIEEEVKPAPTPPMVEKKKKKKKKQNKISIGWNTSSEDSEISVKDEDEVSEYEEEPHEEEPLQFKSDHEFSPESDLEGDEQLPHKRARTARKEESDDVDAEEEFHCQKCGKSDHPEWILLCDKCDNGWHCSCLRPALFVIPEGDWYCPTCQHEKLVKKLHEKLVDFDKLLVKKKMEDRRKERLAYVGISLNNVLPAKDKKDKHKSPGGSGGDSESESGSESADTSDSDEPIYQLRQRRQAHSYKFQDYDDLINSALQEEPPVVVEKTHTLGRGKDIATIVNAAKEEEERNAEKNGFEDLPPVVPKDISDSKKKALSYRKKPKRLNNLEVNSDDEADDSDEDFKGSSSDETEEDDFEEDSEDSFVGRKKSRPVRRSSRARTTRFDADFINDDDSDDAATKKKKKKISFDDSESEESDNWRGGKKKSRKIYSHKKPKKKKKHFDDSDLENYRKKKPKIKYGIDHNDDTRGRRTRGKRTSYLDTLGSDSEEEALKKKYKDNSGDEEYVAEDDDKESEDEFDAEIDKVSEEDKDTRDATEANSEDRNSDSDEEGPLVVKKLKIKKKRTIIDSEGEDENSAELSQKLNNEDEVNDKSENVQEPQVDNVDEPEFDKRDEMSPEKNVEIIPEKVAEIIPANSSETIPEKSEEIRQLEKKALEKPPSVVVPMLNVEKLKACGITLTKVSKEKLDASLSTDDAKSPSNLMEIGVKPLVPTFNLRNNQTLAPVSIERIERNLEGFNDEDVEEMMGNEEYANKQLQLASNEIRSKLIKAEFSSTPALDESKNFVKSPFSIMSNRKLGDNSLKKFRTGRFFNMKPPQEPTLGNSASLGMNNDDNDELSEPPGVTLPLFSEIGPSSMQGLPKSNNSNRVPRNCTPPPMGPNRIIPMVPPHNIGPGSPHLPMPMNVAVNSPYPGGLNSPAGINNHIRLNHPGGPAIGINSIPNIPNSTNPIGGPSAPNIPVVVNMPLVHRSNATTPPSSISPDGTPKKRRGRALSGKGKKTLAAEAAAAAVAAGLPVPEPTSTKTSPNKPLAPNIEIASPPQPFSQSQPAPSVITRMLQNSPGKGAFPVGRIRPKQFAMMPDVDNENEGPRSMESHGDSTHKDVSPHPQRSAHPPNHYGSPVSGQYPPNYYQKDGPGYHHQRPTQSPMHSYPQTPIDQSSLHPPPLNQPPINQQSMNQPPINQPPINQPPINPPPMNAPPISQTPINLSESTPPPMAQYSGTSSAPKQAYEPMAHRPSYANTNSGYGYDYNAPAPSVVGADEVLHPSTYENPAVYPEQYENPGPGLDPSNKNIEEEPSGEFGGLVSYFSSQHEDDLDT